MKSRDRATSKLLDSVRQELNMYALAAGAAGVSVMALAQPSEAKIVYTPAHVTIGVNKLYNLDLNNDGITDFAIDNTLTAGINNSSGLLKVLDNRGNGIEGGREGFKFDAFALNRGYRISSKGFFSSSEAIMAIWSCHFVQHTCHTAGDWDNVANRYLGLKFLINRKTHYGWARLSVQVRRHNPITATLTGYAYETIPGKSIVAGRTKGPDDDIVPDASLTSPIPDTPQPASLGMLALGAQGVPLWRRKESEGAMFENN
jgi:hypothetical protein